MTKRRDENIWQASRRTFRYLGTLAGKDFSPMDKDAMLAFLKTR